MLHSFRLKIGLLSLFLSGLLLLGFGVFAVSALKKVGRDRIDRELRALADTQVRKAQPSDHWRRFDESLRAIYGEDASKQLIVKATIPGGDTLHVTPTWPAGLSSNVLPLPLGAAPYSTPAPPNKEDDPRPREPTDDRPPRPVDGTPPGPADDRPPRRANEPSQRPEPPRQMHVRGPVYSTISGSGGEWRAMTIANDEVTLSIAMNLAGLNAETGRFRQALMVAVPLGLLMIVAGGWLIGQMALRPVNLIARTAEMVTAHRLNERIPQEEADEEFQRLIMLINGMLERLDRSFKQATRFSADAAHELKTPLAILQAQTERCLQHAPDGSHEQREYAEQLDEVQRLKVILGKLLLLSQADSGRLPVSLTTINLANMVRATADDALMLAPDRHITIDAPQELSLKGDSDLLRQVFDNLISNAVKFGNRDGSIEMRLTDGDGRAIFTISNSGLPIPEADHGKVFDRFYRGDKSHGRKIEGTGLGLSLAREIARAHGGDLVLRQSDETATCFSLSLPLAQPEQISAT